MPPILAGILSIYGLVVAVIVSGDLKERLPIYTAFLQLAAGISVGLGGLAAGYVMRFEKLAGPSAPQVGRFRLRFEER
jgi:V-type H+-transporting ATPase proteolipid subunit